MANIVVSLSDKTLKTTFFGPEGFGASSIELPEDIAKDSKILDIDKFAEALKNSISQITPQKAKNVPMTYLVEPQHSILEFATVAKGTEDIDEQIISSINPKLPKGTVLENLFYSHKKLAPFVYQFVGVEKDIMETVLLVADRVGIELKYVVPWVVLLPRLINDNQPSIFVSKSGDSQLVVLSELNGVYFVGVYEKEKSEDELKDLVQTLSVYKRVTPITKIYTVNCDSFTLDPSYDVLPLSIPGDDVSEAAGYEEHLLMNKVLETNTSLFATHINLLNILPVPEVEKPQLPVAKIAAGVAVAVLLAVGGYFLLTRESGGEVAGDTSSGGETEVVGESTESVSNEVVEESAGEEAVESGAVEVGESSEEPAVEEQPEEELNRADLKIRVENGSGVAGAAGRTRDFLQELDYDVLSIGDATESDLEKTRLEFKDSVENYRDMLIADMSENYELNVAEESLDDILEYDVLITVGLE